MKYNHCFNIGESSKVSYLLYGLIAAVVIAVTLLLALAVVLYKVKRSKSCTVCQGRLFRRKKKEKETTLFLFSLIKMYYAGTISHTSGSSGVTVRQMEMKNNRYLIYLYH